MAETEETARLNAPPNGYQGQTTDPEDPQKSTNQNRAKKCGLGCFTWTRANILMIFTLFGIIVGMALGFGLHPYQLSEDAILLIGFPGDVFMRLLKLLILPLIITSLISGKF